MRVTLLCSFLFSSIKYFLFIKKVYYKIRFTIKIHNNFITPLICLLTTHTPEPPNSAIFFPGRQIKDVVNFYGDPTFIVLYLCVF